MAVFASRILSRATSQVHRSFGYELALRFGTLSCLINNMTGYDPSAIKHEIHDIVQSHARHEMQACTHLLPFRSNVISILK